MSIPPDYATSRKLEPRLAAVLAYMFGIITGIILLKTERKDRCVRFHALQSILFSSAVLVLLAVLFGPGFELGAGLCCCCVGRLGDSHATGRSRGVLPASSDRSLG